MCDGLDQILAVAPSPGTRDRLDAPARHRARVSHCVPHVRLPLKTFETEEVNRGHEASRA